MTLVREQGAVVGVGTRLRSGEEFDEADIVAEGEALVIVELEAVLVAAVRAGLAERLGAGDTIGELDSVTGPALSLLEACGADADEVTAALLVDVEMLVEGAESTSVTEALGLLDPNVVAAAVAPGVAPLPGDTVGA